MAKFLEFVENSNPKQKTKLFLVYNKENGSFLGLIKWFGSFRQYSFFPEPDCVFEKTCLRDIAEFLETLMEERKEEGRKNKEAQMRKGFTC